MKPINIVTTGRTGIEDYMRLSGVRDYEKLNHHPFLVFIPTLGEVHIEIVKSLGELVANYPPETKVMFQWEGKWSSDFFQATVWDFLEYIKENPKEDYQKV